MIKNPLLVLKIIKYLSRNFGHAKKRLDQKKLTLLVSRSVKSQPGQQTIALHILTNLSRYKYNHTMKFGQLIEYNMRNIFLEKPYTGFGGDTIPRPFSRNQD